MGSQAVQEITDRIYRAYRLFFTNKKKGVKCSPPRRRKVKKYRSVTYKQAGYRFLPGGRVSINGHIYRYWDSYDGLLERIEIKTVTVKRNILGEFFVYVTTDSPVTMREDRDGRGEVGIDFGLKTFLTLSDGSVIRSPEFFRRGAVGIRKANRALSHKVPGSNGYVRALKTLYRRHQDIANRRRDWFWKLSHELCSRYGVIARETINGKLLNDIISTIVYLKIRKVLSGTGLSMSKLFGRASSLMCKKKKNGTIIVEEANKQMKEIFKAAGIKIPSSLNLEEFEENYLLKPRKEKQK